MTLSPLIDLALCLRNDARVWAESRGGSTPSARIGLVMRAVVLLYLLYAGLRHVLNPMYRSWFAGIILVFHEMGHLLFMPFGRTLYILGGTIFQLFTPCAAGIYLLTRQRDYFGVAFCAAWLADSLWDMATYVSDANKDALPLVGFGDNPEHDWGTLLTQWHLLNQCDVFASMIRGVAFMTWVSAMALGIWLCVVMRQGNGNGSERSQAR